jgi:hypothetical protein
MSISYDRYTQSQTNYQMQNFDNLSFKIIADLFGNYLTWNELNKYSNGGYINLQVATKLFEDKCILTIWFNKDFIKDIEFKNNGSELIYKLEQMEE